MSRPLGKFFVAIRPGPYFARVHRRSIMMPILLRKTDDKITPLFPCAPSPTPHACITAAPKTETQHDITAQLRHPPPGPEGGPRRARFWRHPSPRETAVQGPKTPWRPPHPSGTRWARHSHPESRGARGPGGAGPRRVGDPEAAAGAAAPARPRGLPPDCSNVRKMGGARGLTDVRVEGGTEGASAIAEHDAAASIPPPPVLARMLI